MLEYTLEPNELTENPDDMRAQVVNVISHTQRDLIDRIMRIGAGLTRSDIASVLEAEKQVVMDIIGEGGAVNTELFNAFPSITGVFDTPNESFDSAKHRVKVHLQPGSALRTAATGIKTKKVTGVVTGTIITSVLDVKTGSLNNLITPGRDVKVVGAKLKVAGNDPSVGLFFVNAADGARAAVDPSDFVVNNPSEVIAVVPDLDPGSYHIQITTQFGAGRLLKTPKTATFDKVLTVS